MRNIHFNWPYLFIIYLLHFSDLEYCNQNIQSTADRITVDIRKQL